MPGDPGQYALDGRANGAVMLNANGQPITIVDGHALPWRPVQLYRPVTDSRDRKVARNSGSLGTALGGPAAGKLWDTPSTLDQNTVLSEDLTKVYVDHAGVDWTLHDMVVELFKAHQAGKSSS